MSVQGPDDLAAEGWAPVDRVDRTEGDQWLDALLRANAHDEVALPDGNFTDHVLLALPQQSRQPARPRHRWIVAVMAIVGVFVGLGVLSGGEELTFLLTGLAQTRAFSLHGLLLAVIPLGVLYWLALCGAWQEN